MPEVSRKIEANIRKYGCHIYDVSGGPLPPWSYSIGLSDRIGVEVIFAGGLYFQNAERREIIDRCISMQAKGKTSCFESALGDFCLRPVSNTWPSELFLGAIDYYKKRPEFLQIYPHDEAVTLDLPRLFEQWDARKFPAWKWLEQPWGYSVAEESVVLTDTDMLGGHANAEVACRFGNAYWEIFSRQPDEIEDKYKRYSPLGTLLALHSDIEHALDLKIGQAIERVGGGASWQAWNGRVADGE